jgi:DNA-binding transcriptional LysR family regulator
VRALGFSKAAEKLRISQPGIRPNKNLEDSWGALKFFLRRMVQFKSTGK